MRIVNKLITHQFYIMSEEINNAAPQEENFKKEVKPEVLESTESNDVQPINEKEEVPFLTEISVADLSNKSLNEILSVFQEMLNRGDHQEMYKFAEWIKAAFYKALKREKTAIGFYSTPEVEESVVVEDSLHGEEATPIENPFATVERAFKDIYSQYKSQRAQFVQDLEHQKEDNLKVKLQIIEDLKNLLETQEDLNRTFPAFRELQTKWRESGLVPQARVKDLYETYQHYVEMFYDYVKINNELRDLDFKKNLEIKTKLCEKAEALIEEENVVSAFAQLQKLHEEWKEFGPVEKEFRESIWERFKEATSQINKKHQHHFEQVKSAQKDNLSAKTILCEKAEEIASRETADSNSWNVFSKELENLQKEWKTIGFASKKDNQKIYDRFRAACDQFYNKKRDYYSKFKDQMSVNMDKKIALCEQAETLKDSTDWKKTTDQLIALQKAWKEIGPVSRKKSEQIWSRFRAACDFFFDNKEKNFGGVDAQYVENLKSKQSLIEEIKSFVPSGNRDADAESLRGFMSRWNEIGFVPFKEKEKIQELFNNTLSETFPNFRPGRRTQRDNNRGPKRGSSISPVRSERDKLLLHFRKIESEIATYENNMGFFATSKNADLLINELNKKIEVAKKELQEIEDKIKSIDNQFE